MAVRTSQNEPIAHCVDEFTIQEYRPLLVKKVFFAICEESVRRELALIPFL
jgi:hypothetical protein